MRKTETIPEKPHAILPGTFTHVQPHLNALPAICLTVKLCEGSGDLQYSVVIWGIRAGTQSVIVPYLGESKPRFPHGPCNMIELSDTIC